MRFAVFALMASLTAGGCGTVVPNTLDWSSGKTDAFDTALLIENVTLSVQCELQDAVWNIVKKENARAGGRKNRENYVEFLEDWGVEVTLTLTIVENTNVNPTVLLAPPSGPSSIFTVSGGLSYPTRQPGSRGSISFTR